MTDAPDTHRCGDAGGKTAAGKPCRALTAPAERCAKHPADPAVPAIMGGRPPFEFDDERLRQLEQLASLLTQDDVAAVLGITSRTLRRKLEEDERVAAAYSKGVATANAKVSQGLLKKALAGDTTAMIWWEKTRAGRSEKQRIEHTITRRSFEDWVRDLPDNELRRLEAMGGTALIDEWERACPAPGGDR